MKFALARKKIQIYKGEITTQVCLEILRKKVSNTLSMVELYKYDEQMEL